MARLLEEHAEWRSADVADKSRWTHLWTEDHLREIDNNVRRIESSKPIDGANILDITLDDFDMPGVAAHLAGVERELIEGRGIALLRGLDRDRYNHDQMSLIYWGVGLHLGTPWAQNKKGHMLGDVIDQGKTGAEADARGNEIGGAAPFPYHSDGSDLVGLMCLQTAAEGGLSTVCNAVTIHNDLVREDPELADTLYKPLPYDFRNEQKDGEKGWYQMPAFTDYNDRLFVRYIAPYIRASQRHEDAPRLDDATQEAMLRVDAMTVDPDYNVFMEFQPGDMQFVNNYHVLHARTQYRDDPASGKVRHLKRLWLETNVLKDRPAYFQNVGRHWENRKTVSQLDAAQ